MLIKLSPGQDDRIIHLAKPSPDSLILVTVVALSVPSGTRQGIVCGIFAPGSQQPIRGAVGLF